MFLCWAEDHHRPHVARDMGRGIRVRERNKRQCYKPDGFDSHCGLDPIQSDTHPFPYVYSYRDTIHSYSHSNPNPDPNTHKYKNVYSNLYSNSQCSNPYPYSHGGNRT